MASALKSTHIVGSRLHLLGQGQLTSVNMHYVDSDLCGDVTTGDMGRCLLGFPEGQDVPHIHVHTAGRLLLYRKLFIPLPF